MKQIFSFSDHFFCFKISPTSFDQVCLDFVSRNLAAVIATDGYRHMTVSCQQLQAEILQTIATTGGSGHGDRGHGTGTGQPRGVLRPRDYLSAPEDADMKRRVRARLE